VTAILLPFRAQDVTALAGSLFGTAMARAANRHYLAMPILTHEPRHSAEKRVSTAGTAIAAGAVSIVIPARDEAANLPALLQTLGPYVRGAGFVRQTIVVDDASQDGTGAVARSFGATVLRLEEVDRSDGWLGKPHACQRGAEAATGEWLLFLDADTQPQPESIDLALTHAVTNQLDAVSILLRQRCETLWERLLLPFAYQQFFTGVDPGRMRDPNQAEAFFNGQFILIRTDVYRRTGGHGAVRGSIVEDMALARALKQVGVPLETLRGEHVGAVRMYQDLQSIRHGFGKNAYAFLATEPQRGVTVALSSTCNGLAIPLIALAASATGRHRHALLFAGVVSWLVNAMLLATWTRRFGIPRAYALLQPLSALVFNAIAIESTVRSVLRLGLTWKGRTYR